ncbi:MAG: hypothetical protein GY832_28860 [Chloroflexi bacterium]|nr:hypothetical protein [Chloroflexota bacterium]
MSVQVLRIRFPGLSVAVSVERPRRQQKDRLLPNNSAKVERDQSDWRFFAVTKAESSLIKLQM